MPTLRDIVYENVREGELYEKLDRNRVRCFACGHCCPIPEGQPGVCKVRYNKGGTLYVPWGYVGGIQCDPVEKKPFFHAYPGALAYSFGMQDRPPAASEIPKGRKHHGGGSNRFRRRS